MMECDSQIDEMILLEMGMTFSHGLNDIKYHRGLSTSQTPVPETVCPAP
jgi:hypothetical protein